MGLAERRAMKDFQDNRFPEWKTKVGEAAGFDVPIDVDWESLATEDQSHLYAECWPKVYFQSLIDGFKGITVDQMGKDALKAALKKVVIKNRGSHYSAPGCYEFADGVLTFDHESCTNVDNVNERAEELRKLLEKKL